MTLINRVLERKPESPADLLTNMNKWTDNMDTSKWYYLDVQEATNSHGYTRKTFNYELWRQMLPRPRLVPLRTLTQSKARALPGGFPHKKAFPYEGKPSPQAD